ncbi:MAG: DNA polymerase ligase N-terminal domain-containing protein [Gemmatimonas sp.]
MSPAKKSPAKRSRAKKVAPKTARTTKSAVRKTAAKKATAKKAAAKESSAAKRVAKKTAPESVRQSLATYRAKRDFTVTAEPSGDKRVAHRKALAFVIQKHEASHLHFDLRLEVDGVMKSWAVPKGPSIDPAVRRLAMEVEDHPIAYNTFEGTIPQGEYGGGTVMLWDRGTWSPDEVADDETPNDAARRALKGGKLAFTFHGKRLKGSFALVRTSRGEDKPQWLLLKHKDAQAKAETDIVAKYMTSVDSGRRMEAIAAGRKPRAK